MNWRVENSKGDNPDFFSITYCERIVFGRVSIRQYLRNGVSVTLSKLSNFKHVNIQNEILLIIVHPKFNTFRIGNFV